MLKEYEKRGYFDEVVALLEAGLSLERAHVRLGSLFDNNAVGLTRLRSDGHLHRAFYSLQQVPPGEAYVLALVVVAL